jgi:macrolide-specific efflux system membrane fusion protein
MIGLTVLSGKRAWLIGGALVVVAAVTLAWWWSARSVQTPTYREAQVKRGDLDITVLATGIAQPRNRLEIKPPIPGRIEQVLIEEGQWVTKGTVLAWMSSTERAALIDAARGKGPEEVKRWEDLYRATPILAPIDGTLILRKVEPGQSFTSSDAVFVMSDRLIVVAQVDETDIGQIKLNQLARLELDAYPGQTFEGRVAQIAFDAKTVNNVTTYEVDVLPRKIPPFMRSGMTANVVFRVNTRRDVLMVPSEAIRVRDGHSYVLRPDPDNPGKPREQEVEVGLSDGKRTEILADLNEGDTLLVASLKTGGRNGSKKASSPFMPSRKR